MVVVVRYVITLNKDVDCAYTSGTKVGMDIYFLREVIMLLLSHQITKGGCSSRLVYGRIVPTRVEPSPGVFGYLPTQGEAPHRPDHMPPPIVRARRRSARLQAGTAPEDAADPDLAHLQE